MRGLGGRTYIVTGAASGIGRATAARLLDEGALVMGADLVVPPDKYFMMGDHRHASLDSLLGSRPAREHRGPASLQLLVLQDS